MEILRAVCERLFPADDSGVGAVDAGATAYIERALATDYAAMLPLYVFGLGLLEDRARVRHGAAFVSLTPEAQDALLHEFESQPPTTAERDFFEAVRDHTIEGLFGDPSWGGNRERVGWSLIGYRTPRLTWGEEDQAISLLKSRQAPRRAPEPS